MLKVAQNYCANSEKNFQGVRGMILFWRWWRAVGDLKHIYWVILIYEFTDKIALIGPSPMTPTEVRAKIRALVLHVLLHAVLHVLFHDTLNS